MVVIGSFGHIIWRYPEYYAVIGDTNGTRSERVGLLRDTFFSFKVLRDMI